MNDVLLYIRNFAYSHECTLYSNNKYCFPLNSSNILRCWLIFLTCKLLATRCGRHCLCVDQPPWCWQSISIVDWLWILCLIKINRLTSAFHEAFHQWISTWKGQKEAMIPRTLVYSVHAGVWTLPPAAWWPLLGLLASFNITTKRHPNSCISWKY